MELKRAGNGWSSADAGECSLLFRSEIKVEICRSGGNISSEYAPREPPDIYLLYLFYTVYVVQSVHTKTYWRWQICQNSTWHFPFTAWSPDPTVFRLLSSCIFFLQFPFVAKKRKFSVFIYFPLSLKMTERETDRQRRREIKRGEESDRESER